MSFDDTKKPASNEDETSQTKNGFLALVSKLVFDEKLPVRFMYKTVPAHLNDTGWRMFTGYETPEYLEDDTTNLIPVAVDKMTQLDPSLTELVEYNAGTVWERTPESEGWERVHDFKIPADYVDVEITNDVDDFKH
ncbi:immunity protein Imm33 domain-containing protein [Amphritea balenae]|uniref:DUF2185 domain-containing protein n=1 Tax=Amphritea balenae TaxID=452629 RepID=A0A3P1SLC1_9GAMM|nr:DUF2185 domain-containing protein [Amphritea balenae]RRC97734.1 DUF2185 domain-containing protein [Amphritea balenae]GGK82595.1 hypothetical protein GCM10007941_36280 [Amphritea balenae]